MLLQKLDQKNNHFITKAYERKGLSMKKILAGLKNLLFIAKINKFLFFKAIFEILINLVTTILPIYLIDRVVLMISEKKELTSIILVVASAFGFFIFRGLSFYVINRFSEVQEIKTIKILEKRLFDRVRNYDFNFHEQPDFLTDFSKASERGPDGILWSYYNFTVFMGSIINTVFVIGILVKVHFIIIIYSVIVLFVMMYLNRLSANLSKKNFDEMSPNFRKRGYIRRQFLTKDALEDIKTSDITDVFYDINDMISERIIKCTSINQKKAMYQDVLRNILAKSILAISAIFLIFRTVKGDLDVVLLPGLVTAIATLIVVIQDISGHFGYMEWSLVESSYYYTVMEYQPNIEVNGKLIDKGFRDLKYDNVGFSYLKKTELALKGINVEIKKGDKIALVGHNGSGKTTFIKLLLRLYDPTEGEILWNGEKYVDLMPRCIRNNIGTIFQNFQLYSFTLAENILLRKVSTEADLELVEKAIAFAGLDNVVSKAEKGINTIVTKEFDNNGIVLSGGEKQKVALARLYAMDNDFMILDEPSSALDPLAEHEIYQKMFEIGKDKTLIFVSHRLSTTINADKILLFDNGEIIERGTHNELMDKGGVYKYMFETQAKNYLDGGIEDERA